MGYTLEGLSTKITSASLAVLQKMSNDMWYGIVTNSHIEFNYILMKFWVVCDAMVLGMKTNLLMSFDMLLQQIKKFTTSWTKLFVMPSNCRGVCVCVFYTNAWT